MVPTGNPSSIPAKSGQALNVQPAPFAAKVKAIMDNVFPDGYSVAIYSGETNLLMTHSGGFARKAIDPPQMVASPTDRVNIASVSKFITAAAVASTLQAKNLSVDTLVSDFLPPSWNVHPLVKTLTFRDLMTHRSGFDNDTNEDLTDNNPDNNFISDGSTYDEIKFSLEKGPTFTPKAAYRYVNMNFNLFRIILPYLDSYDRFVKKVTLTIPVTSQPDRFLAEAYIAIVNKRVFAPSNVASAACNSKTLTSSAITIGQPSPKVAVLLYEYNNPTRPGLDVGDNPLTCGASGWNLSVTDLFRVLQTLLFTEAIVSEKNRQLFTAGAANSQDGLGMNRDGDLAGGKVFSHGGWLPIDERQLHSGYAYFEATKTIMVGIGTGGHKTPSPPVVNWFDQIKTAYQQVYAK
jgi:CubicO group peptidase (beta-lactamase class C family)